MKDNCTNNTGSCCKKDFEYKTENADTPGTVVVPAAGQLHEAVNHPKHYNDHPSGVECLQIVRWMNFNLGNVVKYIWRAGMKGSRLEDLKKAKFYLEDEIKRISEIGGE